MKMIFNMSEESTLNEIFEYLKALTPEEQRGIGNFLQGLQYGRNLRERIHDPRSSNNA